MNPSRPLSGIAPSVARPVSEMVVLSGGAFGIAHLEALQRAAMKRIIEMVSPIQTLIDQEMYAEVSALGRDKAN